MKKYFLIGCAIFFLSIAAKSQNLKKEALDALDERYECFVQLNDSSIIKYSTLKYKTPPMTYGNLYGDGEKLKYQPEDILAYQTDKGYFIRVSHPSVKGLIGHMGYEFYFAERVRRGKLELFFQYASNGIDVTDSRYSSGIAYYVRKGNWIAPVFKNGSGLKLAVQDKKQVYKDFDDSYGKGQIQNIMDIVDAYNQAK